MSFIEALEVVFDKIGDEVYAASAVNAPIKHHAQLVDALEKVWPNEMAELRAKEKWPCRS